MPATGPVVLEGKARSAMNAQVHGLTSRRFELLPGDGPAEFELLVLRLRQEWAAMGRGRSSWSGASSPPSGGWSVPGRSRRGFWSTRHSTMPPAPTSLNRAQRRRLEAIERQRPRAA
jgi:hypothetical protein